MRKVSCNRMELLRLKKRKILACKSHDLLEDKLENLLIGFYRLTKELRKEIEKAQVLFKEFFEDIVALCVFFPKEKIEKILNQKPPLEVEIKSKRLFNLILLEIKPQKIEKEFSYERPALWDKISSQKDKVLESFFKIVEGILNLEKISCEILKTRRRTNALEYILIPYIENTIKTIEMKLAELEREFLLQISRTKDLLKGER